MPGKNPVYLIILTLFSGILACNLLDLGTSSGPECFEYCHHTAAVRKPDRWDF